MSYLSAAGIESCLQYLANTYPAITQLIVLPEASHEGRTIRALKIAHGSGPGRHGVLFLGGVHARELVNPDLLVSLAFDLCRAYTTNTGLTYGGRSYSATEIQIIVNGLDVFFLPLVNPDGRVYVQAPGGYAMWRKNRSPNPGQPCRGVDLNRNNDFLWSSGIGTSSNSCSDVFKGSAAFSEPETRNVRHMLDTYTNIACMVDVHSYSELILYPWGDDDNQTTNPGMNFMNPAYDGLRGTQGGTVYREYIPPADLDWFVTTSNQVQEAIADVRGRTYTVQQGVLLYPTSGTNKDYPYSRHFVDASKRKVYSVTLETGREFQPPYAEALNIIAEVSSGLIQFCMRCLCAVEAAAQGTDFAGELEELRAFRDQDLLATSAGKRYAQLLQSHTLEILEVLAKDGKLRKRAMEVLRHVHEVIKTRGNASPKAFSPSLIESMDQLMQDFGEKGRATLRVALTEARRELKHFRSRSVREGLKAASKAGAKSARKK